MNNIIFQELIKNQRKNLLSNKKLSYSDLKRISSYINTSIFNNDCSIWLGYITVISNKHNVGTDKVPEIKNTSFINFFFNGKKQALHRILYYNFIGELSDSEYLKYSCDNKGSCCTLSHISKVNNLNDTDNLPEINNLSEFEDIKNSKNKKKITVEF